MDFLITMGYFVVHCDGLETAVDFCWTRSRQMESHGRLWCRERTAFFARSWLSSPWKNKCPCLYSLCLSLSIYLSIYLSFFLIYRSIYPIHPSIQLSRYLLIYLHLHTDLHQNTHTHIYIYAYIFLSPTVTIEFAAYICIYMYVCMYVRDTMFYGICADLT